MCFRIILEFILIDFQVVLKAVLTSCLWFVWTSSRICLKLADWGKLASRQEDRFRGSGTSLSLLCFYDFVVIPHFSFRFIFGYIFEAIWGRFGLHSWSFGISKLPKCKHKSMRNWASEKVSSEDVLARKSFPAWWPRLGDEKKEGKGESVLFLKIWINRKALHALTRWAGGL